MASSDPSASGPDDARQSADEKAAAPQSAVSHPLIAIAWMMGALLSFTAMAVAVRELTSGMHAFQMLFIRSVIGVGILAALLSVKGWGQLRSRRLLGHALRNVIHFVGQTSWIFGIALLPLATVSAIEFSTPVWAAVLAVAFLGERMHTGRWIALACGFVGILIILRPGLEEAAPILSAGALIMLLCTFCFGATNVVTKWLTRSESALAILFYMVTMQSLFGAVASAFVWVPVQPADWSWLLLLSVTGLSAHYSLVRAFAAADVAFVAPFEFLRLPLVAVIALLLYAEPFELATLLGAALIFGGNYYSLRRERQRK